MAKRSSSIKALLLGLCISLSVPAHAGWWEDLQVGVQKYWKQISFAVATAAAWLLVRTKWAAQKPAEEQSPKEPTENIPDQPKKIEGAVLPQQEQSPKSPTSEEPEVVTPAAQALEKQQGAAIQQAPISASAQKDEKATRETLFSLISEDYKNELIKIFGENPAEWANPDKKFVAEDSLLKGQVFIASAGPSAVYLFYLPRKYLFIITPHAQDQAMFNAGDLMIVEKTQGKWRATQLESKDIQKYFKGFKTHGKLLVRLVQQIKNVIGQGQQELKGLKSDNKNKNVILVQDGKNTVVFRVRPGDSNKNKPAIVYEKFSFPLNAKEDLSKNDFWRQIQELSDTGAITSTLVISDAQEYEKTLIDKEDEARRAQEQARQIEMAKKQEEQDEQTKQALIKEAHGLVGSLVGKNSNDKANLAKFVADIKNIYYDKLTLQDATMYLSIFKHDKEVLDTTIKNMKQAQENLKQFNVFPTSIDTRAITGEKFATFADALKDFEAVAQGLNNAIEATEKRSEYLKQLDKLKASDAYTQFFKATEAFLTTMDSGSADKKVLSYSSINKLVTEYNKNFDYNDQVRASDRNLANNKASFEAYQTYVTDAEKNLTTLETALQEKVATFKMLTFDDVKNVGAYTQYMNTKGKNGKLLPTIQQTLNAINEELQKRNYNPIFTPGLKS